MPLRILVAYATKHGSTRDVAEAVAERLAEHGLATDVRPAAAVGSLEGYEGVVVGAAIYTGRLHPDARAFLRRHRSALAARPVAVFALGPRTMGSKEVAGSRAQLAAALGNEPDLAPLATVVFGGAFDPAQHRFPFNRLPASDVRDWAAIRAWGDEVAARLGGSEVAA